MGVRAGLFEDIDSMQPERFSAHLADDVRMRFGNAPPVSGRAAVHDVWAGSCTSPGCAPTSSSSGTRARRRSSRPTSRTRGSTAAP